MSFEFLFHSRFYKETNTTTAAAKSLQSCLTLCDPIDPPGPSGSPVPGILQARTLEWVAISFSNAWKWKMKVKLLSHVRLFVTPWTAAYQAPPPMGLSRQEYWSGLPLPSPLMWWVSANLLKDLMKQNVCVRQLALWLSLGWDIDLLWPWTQTETYTISCTGSHTFRLRLELYYWIS